MEEITMKTKKSEAVFVRLFSLLGSFFLGFLSVGFSPVSSLPLAFALFGSIPASALFFSAAGAFLGARLLEEVTLTAFFPALLFLFVRLSLFPLRAFWQKSLLLPTLFAALLPLLPSFLFWPPEMETIILSLCRSILCAFFTLAGKWLFVGEVLHRKRLLQLAFFFFLVASHAFSFPLFSLGGFLVFALLLLSAHEGRLCRVIGLFSSLSLLLFGAKEHLPFALMALAAGLLLPSFSKDRISLSASLFFLSLFLFLPFSEPLFLLARGLEWAAASLLFLLLPVEKIKPFLFFLSPREKSPAPQKKKDPPPATDPLEMLLAQSEKVCRKCRRKETCWGGGYSDTMDAFVHLSKGEESVYFSESCLRLDRLLEPLCRNETACRWDYRLFSRPKKGESLCGDVVSAFSLASQTALFVCDGMGSGKQAASDAELVSSLLEGYLRRGMDPSSALLETGKVWFAQTAGERPVAVTLALLQNKGRCLLFQQGGAAAFWFDSVSVKRMLATSPPLGAERESSPTRFSFFLSPEDRLLLRSDGLIPPQGELADKLFALSPDKWEEMLLSFSEKEDDASGAVIRPLKGDGV